MKRQEAESLILKYVDGNCTPAEKQLVESHYLRYLKNSVDLPQHDEIELQQQQVWNYLADYIGAEHPMIKEKQAVVKVRLWPRVAVVAAAVATVVFGVWFFNYHSGTRHSEDTRNLLNIANDIAPGKYGATITLANGQVIQLDSAKKGVVVGGVAGAAGLQYEDGSTLSSSRGYVGSLDDADSRDVSSRRHDKREDEMAGGARGSMMLTATTAKGQTYEFTLPDGTHVWLNADSKIEFPTQFSGKERRILLQGEAYFVVKHNAERPFRVVSKTKSGREQVVEDIGTEFNINAYGDEATIKTTLVEGSARVISGTSLTRHSDDRRNPMNHTDTRSPDAAGMEEKSNDGRGVILSPNQQAILANGNIKVTTVNTESITDWKNGDFNLDGVELKTALRKIARWYDVEVVYDASVPDGIRPVGMISRKRQLSSLLSIIEASVDVRFKIEGRRVYVSRPMK